MQGRSESGALHLEAHGFHDARVAMAEDGDEDAADGVEVALAVGVPKVEAVGAVDDEGVIEKIRRRTIVDEGAPQQLFLAGSKSHWKVSR